MEIWKALASAGVWFALPVTGFWCLRGLWKRCGLRRWTPLARWGVASSVGLGIWSLPLLVLAELGLYRAWAVGLVGWAMVLAFLWLRSKSQAQNTGRQRWDRWEATLAIGLVFVAGMLWGYPSESLLGGVDQGVYSNVGVFLERQGHLEIPLPSHGLEDDVPGFERMPGFRIHRPEDGGTVHLKPQFAHLFPVWLAQAHGTLGLHGLLRLNGLLALLALSCFYATAVALVPRPGAVLGTLFLAFNPAQIWVGRITLSEILAQVLVWAALALVVRLGRQNNAPMARWAGFLLGLVALARVDGFVLLPLLFVAQGVTCVLAPSRGTQGGDGLLWPSIYQTAIPTFAVAAVTYALWSPFYLEAMTAYLIPVVLVALIALYPLLAGTSGIRDRLQRLAGSKLLRLSAIAILIFISIWAYWVRPIPQPTDEERRQWYAAREANVAVGTAVTPNEDGPNWGRNTFSNLGRYLSPWLLGLAVLGTGRVVWKALQLRVGWGTLVCLVLWGGFTMAYLWDPAVDPQHYWAIRRFVPLVLPGCVLMALLGWRFASRRLARPVRGPAAVVLVFALAVHTALVSGPLAFFVRDQGVGYQLREVAHALPVDETVLVPTLRPGWAKWQTPLYLAFERRLHPFDPSSTRRMSKVGAWIERQRRAGKAVYLLAEAGSLPANCCPGKELAGRYPLNRQTFESTYWPVPKTVRRTEVWLEVYRLPPR